MNIGIIGTAGRYTDGDKLSKKSWDKMLDVCNHVSKKFDEKITLVSGGAAWSDHLAVNLFLKNRDIFDLKLFLPVKIIDGRFDEIELTQPFNCGKTLNFYHRKFSEKVKCGSLGEIQKSVDSGIHVETGKGFHGRNTQIAENSDVLIAFTFGDDKNLKDGGTKDTWDKFSKMKPDNKKFHYNLENNRLYVF